MSSTTMAGKGRVLKMLVRVLLSKDDIYIDSLE